MKLTLSHVFDAPGPHPNGLQGTTEGLWVLDQGDNRISCHDYRDGATLRIFDSDSDRGSGITHSGTHLWVSSTYSCETLKIGSRVGKDAEALRHAGSEGNRRPRAGMAGRGTVDVIASRRHHLPDGSRSMDRAAVLPGPRGPAPRHRLGKRKALVRGNQSPGDFLYDPETGKQLDQLDVEGPEPHGFTLWQNEIWIVDATTGGVFRGTRSV